MLRSGLLLIVLVLGLNIAKCIEKPDVFRPKFYYTTGLYFYPLKSGFSLGLGTDRIYKKTGVEVVLNGFPFSLIANQQLPAYEIRFYLSYILKKGRLMIGYSVPNLTLYEVSLFDKKYKDPYYFIPKQIAARDAVTIAYSFVLKQKVNFMINMTYIVQINKVLPTFTLTYKFYAKKSTSDSATLAF